MRALVESITGLIGHPLGADESLAVAVSGGPDSLALLVAAQAAFGDRVRALTVDHGLRDGSAAEAAGVAAICERLGVAHHILRWEGEKPISNIHAEARTARYRLMGDWCADHGVAWLATGHHADDQAETLLLRLARGSGASGLAGIRATRVLTNGVTVLRPLLDRRRAELRALVDAAGLTTVTDPSNVDPRFDRTHARALLAATPWLDAARLADSAAHLADAEAALAWTTDIAWAGRAMVSAECVRLDVVELPSELTRRLVLRALATLGCNAPSGPDTLRLMARLAAGQSATLGPVKASPGAIWRFEPATARRTPSSGDS